MSKDIPAILLKNGALVDGSGPDPAGPVDVLVEGQIIREVSDRPIKAKGAAEIDLEGRALMPGFIDCHAHPVLTQMRMLGLEDVPPTLATAQASVVMKGMLDRGFTTIRDAAGSDWGLKEAVARGYLTGPRLFISGRALSQTGGHGDFRRRTDDVIPCGCSHVLHMTSRIADGVDQVRHAVRDEMRKGADQIKVMVSGGVASPNDPLESCQYSAEELTAIVEEAGRWGTYVLAHAYTPQAITHAISCGVRSIEHANLIDVPAARLVADKGAYVVPTLVTYDALARLGEKLGMTPAMLEKLKIVRQAGLSSLEICRDAGVKLGFGTDLLGDTHEDQSREFLIRAEVQKPHEVIASATRISAEILGQQGRLGTITAGAIADLLVIDGNPLDDLGLLQDQGRHMPIIMKAGRLHKNLL
jgi:imidazolonepropionase-like amidohydrolase